MNRSFVLGGVVAAIVLAVAIYLLPKPSSDSLLAPAPTSATAGSVPTPEYLFEHPDTLKDAEQKCQHISDPSSLYCSNVQRAESLRMADQYRHASQPQGTAR
jgi:hypothetical protein